MAIYYAQDGRKFLSEGACKRYDLKLFAQTNISYFEAFGGYEKQIIFIKNKDIFYTFIEYLKFTYNEDSEKGYFDYFISNPEKYIGCYVLINDKKKTKLETLQEYKDVLLGNKKEIENIIKNIDAFLTPVVKNKRKEK